MVKMVGDYELISNSPEVKNYLMDTGASEELAKKIGLSVKTTINLTEDDGKWTSLTTTGGDPITIIFKVNGEVFEEKTPTGIVYKSVARQEDYTFIIESTLPDGSKAIRIYEFTEDGVISVS